MSSSLEEDVMGSSSNVQNQMDTSESTTNTELPIIVQEIGNNNNNQLTNELETIDPDNLIINIDVPYVNNNTGNIENSVSRSMINVDNNNISFDTIGIQTTNLNNTNNYECRVNDEIIQSNEPQTVPEIEPTTSQAGSSNKLIKKIDKNISFKNRCNTDKTISDNNCIKLPIEGTPVCPKTIKKAGQYLLGPLIGTSPVKSIVQCLARKTGTDKYYTIKILTLKDDNEYETQDDRQGKMLLHAEYSLLNLLKHQEGVVHHHGFFKDTALGEKITSNGTIYTGKLKKRLCLVLDCLTSHDYNPKNDELLNLQHHVIREKKLTEKESLLIFIGTVKIVAELHKKNIVHRDLKLGNLVLNRKTKKVTITNFCLGKHLAGENDLLTDQRGSPAYISPDVLCGKPYLGKPSDCWQLGVIFYTMLFGQFPFYDSSPSQLFNRIKAANYHIPNDGRVSEGTINLIRNLLVLQPSRRLTAVQVLDSLSTIIETFKVPAMIGVEDQVVPNLDEFNDDIQKETGDKKSEIIEKSKNLPSRPFTDLIKNASFHQEHMMKQLPSPLLSRARPYGQIPVYRVDSAPRELTQAELDRYKHLIPRDNSLVRQHSHSPGSSRRDGVSGRTRASTRYRPMPSSNTPQDSPTNLSRSQSATDLIQNQNLTNHPTLNQTSSAWNPINFSSGIPTGTIQSRSSADRPSSLVTLNSNTNGNQSLEIQGRTPVRDSTIQELSERSENPVAQNLSMDLQIQRLSRMAEQQTREHHARMVSMAVRACLINQNNQRTTTTTTTTDTNRSSSGPNRSIPDVQTHSNNNHSRFREAIVERLVSFRVRMQQNRIDNIEREMNTTNNFISNEINNQERNLVRRRLTLGSNRHTPYSSSFRYLTPSRSISADSLTSRTDGQQSTGTLNRRVQELLGQSPMNFEHALQRLAIRLRTSSSQLPPRQRRGANTDNPSDNSPNERQLQ